MSIDQYAWPSGRLNELHRMVCTYIISSYSACEPRDCYGVVDFESDWNTMAVNPTSGATGLIQFMPLTAKGYGLTIDDIKKGSCFAQAMLTAVYLNERRIAAGLASLSGSDVYMAVFYPKAIGRGLDYPFPASVTRSNPGIASPRDYMRKVAAKHSHTAFESAGGYDAMVKAVNDLLNMVNEPKVDSEGFTVQQLPPGAEQLASYVGVASDGAAKAVLTATPDQLRAYTDKAGVRRTTRHGAYDITYMYVQHPAVHAISFIFTRMEAEVRYISAPPNNCGNGITLRMKDGSEVTACHFKSPAQFRVGDVLPAGTPLGFMGSTGNTTGPHFHVQLKPKR